MPNEWKTPAWLGVLSFVITFLLSAVSISAHDKSACCYDPCVTAQGGASCACNGVCKIDYEHFVFYFAPECGFIEGADNCARYVCFFFDRGGAGEGPCDFQCCSDDGGECIA